MHGNQFSNDIGNPFGKCVQTESKVSKQGGVSEEDYIEDPPQKAVKKKSAPLSRSASSILIVADSSQLNNQLRIALKTLGFARLTSAASHSVGLDRLKSYSYAQKYSLVFYQARDSDMPALEFVESALDNDPDALIIAVSSQPQIDDVFNQLKFGARGFLAVPFTPASVEHVITHAQYGPPLSASVLNAPDRNTALVGCVLNHLYRLSVLKRQIREYPHVGRDMERFEFALNNAVDLALMFCEGGDESVLRELFVEECIARANAAASRLGRTRQRLRKKRGKEAKD